MVKNKHHEQHKRPHIKTHKKHKCTLKNSKTSTTETFTQHPFILQTVAVATDSSCDLRIAALFM